MDKNDFQPDTRYTITWGDRQGGSRPATIYVYRAHSEFLVARLVGGDGLLRKITYAEVLKIVAAEPVAPGDRSFVPNAMLDEKTWRDRSVMQHAAGSPQRGK
ncbi:MAG: hypothetical protein OEZ08_12860 [Betaproteobacteria bacterium]|nr:hypothetical protein [Betaproteobacteria bacterium]